jgi:hypothetical protein
MYQVFIFYHLLRLTVADSWSQSLTTTTSALECVSSASASVSYTAGKSLNHVVGSQPCFMTENSVFSHLS